MVRILKGSQSITMRSTNLLTYFYLHTRRIRSGCSFAPATTDKPYT